MLASSDSDSLSFPRSCDGGCVWCNCVCASVRSTVFVVLGAKTTQPLSILSDLRLSKVTGLSTIWSTDGPSRLSSVLLFTKLSACRTGFVSRELSS